MFSENDRISQRQMKRQIVLVLLCPAFWRCGAFISCALAGFTAAWKA